MTGDLITPGEMAETLHTSVASLANQRYRGEGPPWVRIGAKVFYPRAAWEKYVAANTVVPTKNAISNIRRTA